MSSYSKLSIKIIKRKIKILMEEKVMAYSAKSETIEVGMVQRNSRGEYIKVSAVKSKDAGNDLDVRTYYTSDDNEILPTKKGIRVGSEIAPELLMLMVSGLDAEALWEFEEKFKQWQLDRE